MERNRRKAAGGDVRGRGKLQKIFEFYALLVTPFSLRLWLVRRLGGRRYALTSITVLMALTIHLFNVERISSRFYVFRSVLLGLRVFYANYLYFQLFSKFLSSRFTYLSISFGHRTPA